MRDPTTRESYEALGKRAASSAKKKVKKAVRGNPTVRAARAGAKVSSAAKSVASRATSGTRAGVSSDARRAATTVRRLMG